MDAWSRPHRAGLPSTTKMLVSLLVLLASVLLAVESHGLSIVDCAPHERGTLLVSKRKKAGVAATGTVVALLPSPTVFPMALDNKSGGPATTQLMGR